MLGVGFECLVIFICEILYLERELGVRRPERWASVVDHRFFE